MMASFAQKTSASLQTENKDYSSLSISLLKRSGEEATQTYVNFFPQLIGNATQTILNLPLSTPFTVFRFIFFPFLEWRIHIIK